MLYQPATDQRFAWRFGNNMPRAIAHDTDGRVQRLFGASAQNTALSYFNTDTVYSIEDSASGSPSSYFSYDPADRLKTVSRPGDAQSFDWDGVGNRTAHTRAGVGSSYGLDGSSNRVSFTSGNGYRSFGYDARGNLASDSAGGKTYGYDEFNRTKSFNVFGTLYGDYRSNALNQRVWKGSLSGSQRFHYAPGGLVDPYGLWDVSFNIGVGGNLGAAVGPALGGFLGASGAVQVSLSGTGFQVSSGSVSLQASGSVTTGVGAYAGFGVQAGVGRPKASSCPTNAGAVAEGAIGPAGGNIQGGTDGVQGSRGVPSGRIGLGFGAFIGVGLYASRSWEIFRFGGR
jgi:YD repeat-containing protein